MTAKERVLAVHPEAYTTYNGKLGVTEVWSTPSGGSFLGQARGRWGSEEAAWQNAAESLPAQPEKKAACKHSPSGKHVGREICQYCEEEMVEAKEKTESQPALGSGKPRSNGSLYEFLTPIIAEPKPTPSEPKKLKIGQKVLAPPMEGEGQRRMLTVAGRETYNHREFYRVDEIPGALFLSKSLMRVELPQPDSSSIPDETSALKKFLGVGQKFPDEQQHAIDLVNQVKSLGEHQGKENASLMYAMDVIVNLLRVGRDSSSISTERCPYCNGTKDQCFDNEYCASTHWPKAISTEQTHDEWYAANHERITRERQRQDRENYSNAKTESYIFSEAAWNAAKGQSDGR